MKTLKQLKSLIGYTQSNDVFKDYLKMLENAGVIEIDDAAIVEDELSDGLYEQVANVFGVQLDEELNPIEKGVEP
ncbi:hypothetical protein [Serratia oryzae]|uniref:Uncharacterized protein n=1 Tax=Serratia oryzae TaxID=2034155 RepID=A0A1S8CPV5_9GAMM|nr:hypothetical protein [Serratia oryzae]OMQ26920.1 hypothetical protein BMI79_00910 [Serratia oryzae]